MKWNKFPLFGIHLANGCALHVMKFQMVCAPKQSRLIWILPNAHPANGSSRNTDSLSIKVDIVSRKVTRQVSLGNEHENDKS